MELDLNRQNLVKQIRDIAGNDGVMIMYPRRVSRIPKNAITMRQDHKYYVISDYGMNNPRMNYTTVKDGHDIESMTMWIEKRYPAPMNSLSLYNMDEARPTFLKKHIITMADFNRTGLKWLWEQLENADVKHITFLSRVKMVTHPIEGAREVEIAGYKLWIDVETNDRYIVNISDEGISSRPIPIPFYRPRFTYNSFPKGPRLGRENVRITEC